MVARVNAGAETSGAAPFFYTYPAALPRSAPVPLLFCRVACRHAGAAQPGERE